MGKKESLAEGGKRAWKIRWRTRLKTNANRPREMRVEAMGLFRANCFRNEKKNMAMLLLEAMVKL